MAIPGPQFVRLSHFFGRLLICLVAGTADSARFSALLWCVRSGLFGPVRGFPSISCLPRLLASLRGVCHLATSYGVVRPQVLLRATPSHPFSRKPSPALRSPVAVHFSLPVARRRLASSPSHVLPSSGLDS